MAPARVAIVMMLALVASPFTPQVSTCSLSIAAASKVASSVVSVQRPADRPQVKTIDGTASLFMVTEDAARASGAAHTDLALAVGPAASHPMRATRVSSRSPLRISLRV